MMGKEIIEGKSIEEWAAAYPLLNNIMDKQEVLWVNPDYGVKKVENKLTKEDILSAEERLKRFAPYIEKVFPETSENKGMIESPLVPIPNMQHLMEQKYNIDLRGKMFLKCDSHLPISGSIKARGGIYEVLKHAEELALKHGLLDQEDRYTIFESQEFKNLFNQYSIAVGSTGNLGLSIGIISAVLGFKVTVHMSADAKQWKKELLRTKGVQVLEYQSDYSKAVEEGRKQAFFDQNCYFIDDEDSSDLFLGYSVAASRLKKQLDDMDLSVDADHSLFIYLPCGVGGGPGGITFGLKMEFGDLVHCFFAEPTHSPCFLIGQMTGLQDKVSVHDFGLDNRTHADGLAVARPSRFVGKTIGHMLSGCFTIHDERLFSFLHDLADVENIYLEPSALAGFYGPIHLLSQKEGLDYLRQNNLLDKMKNAHHIIWATGGNMVPREVMEGYFLKK